MTRGNYTYQVHWNSQLYPPRTPHYEGTASFFNLEFANPLHVGEKISLLETDLGTIYEVRQVAGYFDESGLPISPPPYTILKTRHSSLGEEISSLKQIIGLLARDQRIQITSSGLSEKVEKVRAELEKMNLLPNAK